MSTRGIVAIVAAVAFFGGYGFARLQRWFYRSLHECPECGHKGEISGYRPQYKDSQFGG